jgi:hypothetical protein
MAQIAQREGILNLWRGLTPALVGSLPSTVLYYTGYESLRDILLLHTQSPYSPMFAGAIARTLVVGLISPLELFRTRMQADSAQFSAIMKDVRTLVQVMASNAERWTTSIVERSWFHHIEGCPLFRDLLVFYRVHEAEDIPKCSESYVLSRIRNILFHWIDSRLCGSRVDSSIRCRQDNPSSFL